FARVERALGAGVADVEAAAAGEAGPAVVVGGELEREAGARAEPDREAGEPTLEHDALDGGGGRAEQGEPGGVHPGREREVRRAPGAGARDRPQAPLAPAVLTNVGVGEARAALGE